MYRKTFEVIGYVYEAGIHCPDCSESRFGDLSQDHEDREGNIVTPYFLGDSSSDDFCDTCLEALDC